MQIKKIALAALAVASFTPAFAEIIGAGVAMGQAELVFVAYNDKASFVKDLGITTDAFLAQMNATGTFSTSVLGSEYSRFLGQNGSSTEWAIIAANPIEFGFNPGEINYYGTKNVAQATFGVNNQLFNDGVQNLAQFFSNTDDFAENAGIGASAGINNIEYTGLAGTIEHAVGYSNLGNAYNNGNAVGVASEMVYLTSSSANGSHLVVGGAMGNQTLRANFDGVNITAVQAVPEPSTYAMLLAGLCAVGFVARRRQA
ncbi:FxDxF family PEP-CTERM protein [Roseateles oligotrophus]|uniref:FxDxF family PEP-CTERM protein n=1 Tax=Roseateles oligotrophus TaxID=1769250 RepID=A0ABT2YB57_9BURK|nr:FxDxF family PEP-CTERM protein [Roseateles oligotrophus]MCV2367305.1 FxDxF family PEP-CTERM protein [Roseateles oligotrophus]